MSSEKRGLGRGLDALFGNTSPVSEGMSTGEITDISIDLLVTNSSQPRKFFDETALQELASSISEQGIMQPILVRALNGVSIVGGTKYEIIAGERRYRAALLAGIKKIPVFIRNLTDAEAMAAALIENVQREDLNPIEEANALKMLREQFMMTQDELSKKIGKSRPAIANALRLLNLSAEAQSDLASTKINVGHARCILSIDDVKAQKSLHSAIISENLTVRDAENAVSDWKNSRPFFWENGGISQDEKGIAKHDFIDAQIDIKEKEKNVKPKVKSNRAKSESIKEMQKKLNEQLNLRANISGNEQKGRITLAYQNAEEYLTLLQKLGIQE